MSEGKGAEISVRNVDFDFEHVPRYWHGDRRAVSIFFNNLSTVFPLGERFFIRSVARYRGQLDDARLLAQVRAFTSQEAIHTREHEAYNAMLRRRGYDVDRIERGVAWLLRLPRLSGPLRDRVSLASTVALEHWTALLGHFLLANDQVLDGAEPTLSALWRWHAVEECEHKAVAFDVYARTGGGYVVRVVVMLLTSAIFWARILHQQWMMMRSDGLAWRREEWRDLARFLFVEQRVHRLLPLWWAYFAPRFHPHDVDDRALIGRWRRAYADSLRYRADARPAAAG